MLHVPVLAREAIDALSIDPEGVYVDATFGRGGHAALILERLRGGRLICFDRDEDAINEFRNSSVFEGVTFVSENFSHIGEALSELGIEQISGVLFDLGVSSPQLDDAERGFSYMHDARLDMRMDRRQRLTAEDVVNLWPEAELERIFREYGEERYSRSVARMIVRERERKPVDTTLRLSDIIRSAMPGKALSEPQHPARRVFQAIRIAVNDELTAAKTAIIGALGLLKTSGRIAVISFHSLEDRLVKQIFAEYSRGCVCPADFPACICGKTADIRIIGRKPITAKEDEMLSNPRSRSAKLRIAEKIKGR